MGVYLAFFNKTMLVTFHHCNKIFKKNNLKKKRLGFVFRPCSANSIVFYICDKAEVSWERSMCNKVDHSLEVRNYSESRKGL